MEKEPTAYKVGTRIVSTGVRVACVTIALSILAASAPYITSEMIEDNRLPNETSLAPVIEDSAVEALKAASSHERQGFTLHQEYKDDGKDISRTLRDEYDEEGLHYKEYDVVDEKGDAWYIEYCNGVIDYASNFKKDGTVVIWNYRDGAKEIEMSYTDNVELDIMFDGPAGQEKIEDYSKCVYWPGTWKYRNQTHWSEQGNLISVTIYDINGKPFMKYEVHDGVLKRVDTNYDKKHGVRTGKHKDANRRPPDQPRHPGKRGRR